MLSISNRLQDRRNIHSKLLCESHDGHREREVTKEFLRLKSHFLYEDHFCLVRRPNEKGHVERLLDFARRSFLVPVPCVESLEELNTELGRCCEKDLDRTLRGNSAAKRELLKDERGRFLSIPNEQFEARRLQTVHANSLSLIRFDRNSYRLPTDVEWEFAERTVEDLWNRIGTLLDEFSEQECTNYFKHCGYT